MDPCEAVERVLLAERRAMSPEEVAGVIRQHKLCGGRDSAGVSPKRIAELVRSDEWRDRYLIDTDERVLHMHTYLATGPLAWRNWCLSRSGVARKQRLEHGLYSDSAFVGELDGLGPYTVINALSRDSGAIPGDVSLALVLRHDDCIDHTPLLVLDRQKSEAAAYHGGWIDDEFAALLSLALGVRCRSGGPTRFWSTEQDDVGRPMLAYHTAIGLNRPRYPILPSVTKDRVDLASCRELLEMYPLIDPGAAKALARAARQYQLAIWWADEDPNLAWLQLVGALEAAAAPYEPEAARMDILDEVWPELANVVRKAKIPEQHPVVKELAQQVRATKKVRDLVGRYMPDPPGLRPPEHQQVHWPDLVKIVARIYGVRSSALHEGVPFPAPLLQPPTAWGSPNDVLPERPGGAIGVGDAAWTDDDLPIYLHTFEYVVRQVLLGWWRNLAKNG